MPSGLKVTAMLLKGWILSIGGASAGEGVPCSLNSRLVLSTREDPPPSMAQQTDRQTDLLTDRLLGWVGALLAVAATDVFTESAPLGRFSYRVAMSIYLSDFCLFVPLGSVCFDASHWP